MTDKFVHSVLLVLTVALLLAGSWLLGRHQGESDAQVIANSAVSSVEAQRMIFSLQAELAEKNAEILNANRYTLTCDARTQALQTQLDSLLRENLSNSRDLDLYRRIETSVKRRSVDLGSLQWSALQPDKLDLTLIQWRGRDRIKGEVHLILNYPQSVPGAVLQGEKNDSGAIWAVRLEPLAFDFRFFQKFSATIIPPIGDLSGGNTDFPLPESVDVRTITPEERLKGVDTRISWTDIAE